MKGIIFDFNGTMFQDSHLHEAAWVHMVKKYSKGELTEHDISVNLHGRTNKEILNFFVSDSLTDEEIEKNNRTTFKVLQNWKILPKDITFEEWIKAGKPLNY